MKTGRLSQRAILALAALTLLAALASLGSGAWIHAKAVLAQWLLEDAWSQTLEGARQVHPWPWADTWPVARLDLGAKGGRVLVLAGATGRTLAFGPGHLEASPLPGEGGNSVIAGHRDTHFAVLRNLARGDEITVELPGHTLHYQVSQIGIVDEHQVDVTANHGEDALTLITCYPFDAVVPGGPLRYVVYATRVSRGGHSAPPRVRGMSTALSSPAHRPLPAAQPRTQG